MRTYGNSHSLVNSDFSVSVLVQIVLQLKEYADAAGHTGEARKFYIRELVLSLPGYQCGVTPNGGLYITDGESTAYIESETGEPHTDTPNTHVHFLNEVTNPDRKKAA